MKIGKNFIISKLNTPELQSVKKRVAHIVEKTPAKTRNAVVTAAIALAAFGVGRCSKSCESDIDEGDRIENVISENDIKPVDFSERKNYIEKTEKTEYTVRNGDNPSKVANNFNVSTRRLLHENGMKFGVTIYPNDVLAIPESYKVTNISDLNDVSKLMGLQEHFIKELKDTERMRDTIYIDARGNETIGIGHLITTASEREMFKKMQPLSEKQMLALFAQDLLDADLDFETMLSEDAFKEIPQCIKEGITDLMFNRGSGAIINRTEMIKELQNKNYDGFIKLYVNECSHLRDSKGNKKEIDLSGLCKRSLYDLALVSKYYKGDTPQFITDAAKKVYERGLVCMEKEKNKGDIPAGAYPNVLKEYKNLAYNWFDGKIGAQSSAFENRKAENKSDKSLVGKSETVTDVKPESSVTPQIKSSVDIPADKSKIKIKVDGGKETGKTFEALYTEWESNAKRWKRTYKRPLPEIDKNGNITATVKVLEPTGKGAFSGKTIIVNPGHGGCMNTTDTRTGALNTNFDPGASNAVMSSGNPNIETNEFIGNDGKALEEWVVNMKISDSLTDKIRAQGGKVIYVQGSVYSAQNAVRDIVKKNNVNMLVSLHSNSSVGRGIYIFGNKRGGVDKSDEALAKTIESKMNEHNWFRGIVKQDSKSLGVLSKDRYSTLDIPAVLIETGNLKHPTDIANLNSRQFKDYMVDAIINGMKDYK